MFKLTSNESALRAGEYNYIKITAEGLLFHEGRLMGESFARAENFRRWKRKRGAKRYEESVERMPVHTVESAVWVTDDWSKGYFHWLADVLPRIVIAAARLQTSTLLLPARFRGSELVRESFELFGIRNFDFVGDDEAVLVRRLYLPGRAAESGEFDPGTINEVRQTLIGELPPGPSPERRIYISRRSAKRRKVANEAELNDVLSSFGFETIVAEDMPLLEQIRLFSSVSHLVSIHGAGLANMLFMPQGGRILELRKIDPRSPECFANMAAALGHEFRILACTSVADTEPPYTADLIADPESFRRSLSDLLPG